MTSPFCGRVLEFDFIEIFLKVYKNKIPVEIEPLEYVCFTSWIYPQSAQVFQIIAKQYIRKAPSRRATAGTKYCIAGKIKIVKSKGLISQLFII